MLSLKSGNLIRLRDLSHQFSIDLLVEIRGDDVYSFAKYSNPYQRMSISQHGTITFKEKNDKSCFFTIEFVDDPSKNLCRIKPCYMKVYLEFDSNGLLVFSSNVGISMSSLELLDHERSHYLSVIIINDNPYESHSMNSLLIEKLPFQLQRWQIHRFMNEGYLQLSNIITSDKIAKCCKFLNSTLGKSGSIIPGFVIYFYLYFFCTIQFNILYILLVIIYKYINTYKLIIL